MRHLILMLSLTVLITGCLGMRLQTPEERAAQNFQPYWSTPDRPDVNRQKDDLECKALAAQASASQGGWTSVAPLRDAIYQQNRQHYYHQCLESRGYRWVTR